MVIFGLENVNTNGPFHSLRTRQGRLRLKKAGNSFWRVQGRFFGRKKVVALHQGASQMKMGLKVMRESYSLKKIKLSRTMRRLIGMTVK
jgi:hypothetical protein